MHACTSYGRYLPPRARVISDILFRMGNQTDERTSWVGAQLSFIRASPVSKPRPNHPPVHNVPSSLIYPTFPLPFPSSSPPLPPVIALATSLDAVTMALHPISSGSRFQNGQASLRERQGIDADLSIINQPDVYRHHYFHDVYWSSATSPICYSQLIGALMNTLMNASYFFRIIGIRGRELSQEVAL